jgi:hypothetical protein
MSADIISLQEWRRKHCEHHRHENMSVTFPFVLPTWPFGWLRPMLMEIEVPPEGFPNQMFPDSDG